MKTKWRPILVVFLALLLACSVVVYIKSYTKEDVKAARDLGYDEGYTIGFAACESAEQQAHDRGYENGYYDGYEDGYAQGEEVGYDKGYQAGVEYGDFDGQASAFPLDIISVTSPVNPGDYATLKAKTIPNAACYIGVFYESGRSEAAGLLPKFADDQGNVSWTWKVGTRTTPGRWMIVVIAYSLGDWEYGVLSTLEDVYFEVQ